MPIPFDNIEVPDFPIDALPSDVGDYVVALSEQNQTPVDMTATISLAVLSVTKLMAQGYIDQVLFNRECNALSLQAENYKSEKESLSLNVLEGNARLTELTSLLHFVKRSSMLTEYDEDLFKQFVKRIIVFSRDEIGFELKCGLLLRERM